MTEVTRRSAWGGVGSLLLLRGSKYGDRHLNDKDESQDPETDSKRRRFVFADSAVGEQRKQASEDAANPKDEREHCEEKNLHLSILTQNRPEDLHGLQKIELPVDVRAGIHSIDLNHA